MSSGSRVQEFQGSSVQKDSLRVEREVVAIRDTVREVTTIHIQTNETGDTLKVAQVTERDRIRDRAQVSSKEVEVRVVRDTVYIERTDSVLVQKEIAGLARNEGSGSRASPFVTALKWIFWIIVAVGGLTLALKFKGLKV